MFRSHILNFWVRLSKLTFSNNQRNHNDEDSKFDHCQRPSALLPILLKFCRHHHAKPSTRLLAGSTEGKYLKKAIFITPWPQELDTHWKVRFLEKSTIMQKIVIQQFHTELVSKPLVSPRPKRGFT